MTQYSRPTAGTPATLIMSEAFQGDLVDIVNAYHRGELTRKPARPRQNAVVMVVNKTGATLAQKQLVSIEPTATVSDELLPSWTSSPVNEAVDVVWPDNIGRLAILREGCVDEQTAPIVTDAWVAVEIVAGEGGFVFVDPLDPKQLREGSGGIGKILFRAGSTAVIDRTQTQNLWRVEVADDLTTGTLRTGKLFNLSGNEFAPTAPPIDIQDPYKDWEDLETGDFAWALYADGLFYAMNTGGAIDCEKICNKCDPVASETGECTPETAAVCCEAISTARCKYTNKAITGLSLDYDGTTYVQVGDSDFPGPTSTCAWRVPVSIDGASTPVDAFVTREDGANTWVVSAGGRTWKTNLDTSCGGTKTVNTDDAMGTGSFTATDKGECDPPPTETNACGETYPGTIYPRVRVTGYPESYSTQSSQLQFFQDTFGVEGCDGTAYNSTITEIQNANGTFLGPPLLEPADPLDPPEAPVVGTQVCHEISLRTALYNNANLQCTTNDVPCTDPNLGVDRNHTMTVEAAGFRFRAYSTTTYQGDMTCQNATGIPDLLLPAPTCAEPNRWQDIRRTYNVTLRRLINDTPFTYQCFDIQIEMDYVLA